MRHWFTVLILLAALLGGVVGVGAHEQEGSCPMTNMPDCCKKAHSSSNTPEVSLARLCCNLNCSEPGSGGPSTSSSVSPQPLMIPIAAVIPNALAFDQNKLLGHYSKSPNPNDSNPKYIQHLALLI